MSDKEYTALDSLLKYKNKDSSIDVIYPLTKTSNVKTSEDIEVMLTGNIGSFKNGDIIPANTTVDDVIRKLLQVQIPPVYTEPSVSVVVSAGSGGGSYEEGTSVSAIVTATFTQNDAGPLSTIEITKNGTSMVSGNKSTISHTETFTVSGTTTFTAIASYGEGETKQDNFGNDYPTGKIASGSKTSNSITYKSYRKYFWGCDSSTSAPANSSDVRALSNASTSGASEKTTIKISVKAGESRVCFAYPATLRDVSSIKYVEFNNDEIKSFFNSTVISVEGANGYAGIDYKVYTYIPDQPFPSDMTFNVTI